MTPQETQEAGDWIVAQMKKTLGRVAAEAKEKKNSKDLETVGKEEVVSQDTNPSS